MSSNLLRLGAVAAVLAVIAQLVVAFVEPGRSGDADEVIRDIAESGNWTGRWLVHLAGIVLIVLAWAVVARTFSAGTAKEWSRVGLVFIAITGALGMAQILVGAGTKDLADSWAAAAPSDKAAYFAAFEGAWNDTVNLDFGTIVAGGVYLLTLAAAILSAPSTHAGSAGPLRAPVCSCWSGPCSNCGHPSGRPLASWESCSSSSCSSASEYRCGGRPLSMLRPCRPQ